MTGTAAPGGPWTHAARLADALIAGGTEAEVVALARPGGPVPAAARAPVRRVDSQARAVDPAGEAEEDVARLARALADAPAADVLHAEDPIAGAAALRARGEARVVVTVHHLEAAESEGTEELQRVAVQGADARATATRFWAGRIETLFGAGAEVIANGVDAATFAEGPGRAAAGARLGWGPRPVVLGLGGIARRKGSRLLLEAFARARSRLGAEPLLAVAGAAPAERDAPYSRAFVEDAERLGLVVADHPHSFGADVVLLGPIPPESMPVLVRAADVLAVPSTREGSPLAVLEAAVAGRAAVVSDLPSLRETLTHGVHALMVPPGEAGPLADAIVGLVRSPDLAEGLAREAAGLAREATWEAAAAAYRELYEVGPEGGVRR